jgi:uncharacterized protein (TIGR02588 family)
MRKDKNWLEWTAFAVGLVLVLGTLGYLAYDGFTMEDQPPYLEIRLGAPLARENAFLVPVAVTNRGDQSAEDVRVEVVLAHGQTDERGELDMAFLPRGATRHGWVTFHADPRSGTLTSRVLGYERP